MLTYHTPPPQGHSMPWMLFTCSFEHKGIAYRAAVAQHSDTREAFAGEAGFHHHVLLQSGDRFYHFVMWKGEEDIWVCDHAEAIQEIVFLLGREIEKGQD